MLAFEQDHNITQVAVDDPQGFSSSVPPVWEVTNPELAIFRLHGRNAETWIRKGLTASSGRFDYDYQDAELNEFVEPVLRLAREAKRVHVVFNNNMKDQGIRGATTFNTMVRTVRVAK